MKKKAQKAHNTFCISWKLCAIVLGVFLAVVWWKGDFSEGKQFVLGATFSQPYATYLGNNWRANYLALLDDLDIKHVRLVAYWDAIEKIPGEYDFTDLDWQMAQARAHKANVILALGRKVPRWPECTIPPYLLKETENVQNMALTKFIRAVITHYHDDPAIVMWQIENEPFVKWFGNCPNIDRSFVGKEVALAHTLDARPVLLTDSGELGWWYREGKLGNYFGTTMYHIVWSNWFGYVHYYFFTPFTYRLKAFLTGINPERALIAELQAEAWFPNGNKNISLAEQRISMNAEQLRANVDVARRTGFGGAYLWGAEYWYWLKGQGDDSMWKVAGELFKQFK